MKKHAQFFGLAGLTIFTFGLITQFLSNEEDMSFAYLHLACGLGLIALFFISGGLQLLGKAAVKRAAGFGAGVTVYSALFLGILVVVNYGVKLNDPLYYDSTEQQVYTLAPQTEKVLNSLEDEILVRAFFVSAEIGKKLEDLLSRMARISDKFSWVVVDPEKNPALTESLGIIESNTLHLSFKSGDSDRVAKVVRETGEQEIVDALLKLTRGGQKTVYYTAGHGEADFSGEKEGGFQFLRESIEGENIALKPLVLRSTSQVPDDAAALLLMAPRKELLAVEKAAFENYLSNGGNALLLTEPTVSQIIAPLVAPLGIDVGKDVILDQVLKMFSAPEVGVQPMVTSYGRHASTRNFAEGTVYSTVSSVRRSADAKEDERVTELAFTSDKSWAEKKLELIFSDDPQAALEEEDLQGPVSIAAAFEGSFPVAGTRLIDVGTTDPGTNDAGPQNTEKIELAPPAEAIKGKSSRVLVIGDSDFVSNINIRQLYNRDFFLNALNWVIGEGEKVSIRAKTMRSSTKGLSEEQFRSMFLFTAILLPELILLSGFSVWWFRKQ